VSKDQVVLSITKDRTILIDRYKVPLSGLADKLRAVYKNRADKEIFLNADKSVPYGFVVKTMAEIKAAGIDRMSLITESPD